jgi:hypothetical protein
VNRMENSDQCICYVGVAGVLTSLRIVASGDLLFGIVEAVVGVDLAQLL